MFKTTMTLALFGAFSVFAVLCLSTNAGAEQVTLKQHLATTSGAEAWKKVKQVSFTWTHKKKNVSRSYVWMVQARKVKVTINKTTKTIDLNSKVDQKTNEYKAFINDSYWPFFMLHASELDSNVSIVQLPIGGKLIKGATIAIRVAYGDVGPSPKDIYYIHLTSKYKDVGWLYQPAGATSPKLITTREQHKTLKGITVPTVFKTLKGQTVIEISNLNIQ